MKVAEIEDALQSVDDATRMYSNGGQRKLASFDTYFRFGDIVDRFWKETEDESEKLFYFPIYLWWKVSGRTSTAAARVCLNAEELPASCQWRMETYHSKKPNKRIA